MAYFQVVAHTSTRLHNFSPCADSPPSAVSPFIANTWTTSLGLSSDEYVAALQKCCAVAGQAAAACQAQIQTSLAAGMCMSQADADTTTAEQLDGECKSATASVQCSATTPETTTGAGGTKNLALYHDPPTASRVRRRPSPEEVMADDPLSGTAFVFRNRRRTMVRVLFYDGQGFNLLTKRLSTGYFRHWISASRVPRSGPTGGSFRPQWRVRCLRVPLRWYHFYMAVGQASALIWIIDLRGRGPIH